MCILHVVFCLPLFNRVVLRSVSCQVCVHCVGGLGREPRVVRLGYSVA